MPMRPVRVRAWAATLGTLAAYLALYVPMGRLLGLGWIPFGILPIVVAAWFFGLRGGAPTAVFVSVAGTTLAASMGAVPWGFFFDPTNLVRLGAALLVGGLVGHTRDLRHGLERDHARLASAESHLAQAHELAGLGSWTADLRAAKITSSVGLGRILGIPAAQPIGFVEAIALLHPEDRERVASGFERVMASGSSYEDEVRVEVPGRGTRHVRIRSRVERDPGGTPARITGIAQDVTELRRAEEQKRVSEQQRRDIERLAELNRFKSRFVSAAAHELNTPMTPIILQMELLRSPEIGPLNPLQQRSLGILERNIRRLAALLRDLLDASRLQSQGLRLTMESVDPSSVVQEAVESFRLMAEREGIRLQVDAPSVGPMWIDPRRLSQVAFNLVSNAVKFTPGGRSIRVATRLSGQRLRITVQDEGIGMRPDQLARLFQPFSRVADDGAAHQGTGLGLYVCRGIVEQMGGTIKAESKGPGLGASFTVDLPLVRVAPSAMAVKPMAPVPAS